VLKQGTLGDKVTYYRGSVDDGLTSVDNTAQLGLTAVCTCSAQTTTRWTSPSSSFTNRLWFLTITEHPDNTDPDFIIIIF